MGEHCPACDAAHAAGDRFCADCGARLGPQSIAAASGCTGCGGTIEAGFCSACGARQAPGTVALVLGPRLAAVTDPGRQHPENQDAFRIAGPGPDRIATLVVCDGVSNSQTPAAAAALAAEIASTILEAATGDHAAAMRHAIVAAHHAICALPYDRQSSVDPPACTIVAAHVRLQDTTVIATLGWLGDSRAYAIGADGAILLTHDHSWVNQVVDAREMRLSSALLDRRAHALTRCLGTTDFAGASPCPEPSIRGVTLERPGCLLLCTDGLWNYADTASALLRTAGQWREADAETICKTLLASALIQGGHDNITVAASLI